MANDCTCSVSEIDGWKTNSLAAGLAMAACILISICYIYNMVGLVLQKSSAFQPQMVIIRFIREHQANVGALSATMASILGLVFVFGALAPWPQPLEAAAIVTVVFAQLSALIWQNHPCEGFGRVMIDRIPDVFAVFVAILTMSYTAKLYHDINPKDDFSDEHQPYHQINSSYVLTGISLALGIICAVFDFKKKQRNDHLTQWIDKAHFKIIMSLLFFSLQVAIVVYTIYFTSTTLAEDSLLFNSAKIIAFVTLCLGALYSAFMGCAGSLGTDIEQETQASEMLQLNYECPNCAASLCVKELVETAKRSTGYRPLNHTE